MRGAPRKMKMVFRVILLALILPLAPSFPQRTRGNGDPVSA